MRLRLGATLLLLLTLLAGVIQPAYAQRAGAPANLLPDVLDVKFRDGLSIRLRNGVPTDLGGRALQSLAAREALAVPGQWLRKHSTVSEKQLDAWQLQGETARQLAGAALPLPNLNLYFRLLLDDPTAIDSVMRKLQALPEVEAVYRVAAPMPPPQVPDFYTPRPLPAEYQAFHDYGSNSGIGSRFLFEQAAAYPNTSGSGMKVCDVEYDWNLNHIEMRSVTLLNVSRRVPMPTFKDHGTAMVSIMTGKRHWNADGSETGVRGIAYYAQNYLSPIALYNSTDDVDRSFTFDVDRALTACAAAMAPGNIIVIEAQMRGPNYVENPYGSQKGSVPVEWAKSTYDTIRTLTSAGYVVVEAAGNGSENLDDPIYGTGHAPFKPGNQSGAILVGAGMPGFVTTLGAGTPVPETNYGAVLMVQGWGRGIIAAGYGDRYSTEGSNAFYGEARSTSAATAMVGGAVTSLQGFHYARTGTYLNAYQIVAILYHTGTPQASGPNIGRQIDLVAAIEYSRLFN